MAGAATPRRPFALARRLLLAAIGLASLGLGGLYWIGRSRPLEAVPEQREESLAGATAVSEGFEYTQVLAGQPVFRLRGDRFRSTPEEKVAIEGVALTLFRPEGEVEVSGS